MDLTSWLVQFKALFPEFVPIIDDNGNTVTDDAIADYLGIAMDILPQALVHYLEVPSLARCTQFMTAHLLKYYNVKNGYAESRQLLRNATSMSADGLSVGYEGIAKLRGDSYPSLNDFLNTTAYGRTVTLYLEKLSGSVGGFIV